MTEAIPVLDGTPSGVTPDEWKTWYLREAAVVFPDGRRFFITKDEEGGTVLMPVVIVTNSAPYREPA